jgi:Uma2 family endonuclease
MATIVESKLLTSEEFAALPKEGDPLELVLGEVVVLNRPFTSHGYHMAEITGLLREFVKSRALGRVVSGDAGVVTHRNPDSVRGPDVAYYSYARIPAGPLPEGYWPASPELVVEIRSPGDRWKDTLQKVAEYLQADVVTVLVIDPELRHVNVYSANSEPKTLTDRDVLQLPDVLPGFEVPVKKLFE